MTRGQLRTLRPNQTGVRLLGQLGTLSGLTTGWTLPGGCDQLTVNLQTDPMLRTDALDNGRIIQVMLGGGTVWDGKLEEPSQAQGAWSVTAQGSGTAGSLFDAQYSGAWATAAPDQVINDAIGRGLNWVTSSIGHPAGTFLKQPPDSGSIGVDDMLNQLTQLGGLTWQVKHAPRGNIPEMWPVSPLVPNRLLVVEDPAPRTLGGDYNALLLRYMITDDGGSDHPATFGETWCVNQPSIDKHGRRESFYDLQSVGPMLLADVQAVGNAVLSRYQAASFAGPFTIRPGQLMTLGGQAQDLGVFYIGNQGPMVCRALLIDTGFGGEVLAGPVTFMVGSYVYDYDSDTAQLTPFQSLRSDFSSLVAAVASGARRRPVRRHRRLPPGHLVSVTSRHHRRHPPGHRMGRG